MRFLLRVLVTAAALAVAAWLIDGIRFDGPSHGWDEVREKIVPLLLVALTESLGVSRPTVRETLDAYITAVHEDASYQELNARHLTFHVSLVGLTGSERLVAMAETLATELRLALAQVERIRRNAHDQADSHAALVRLLDDGDIDGASAFLDRHLADAETEIITALQL